MPQPKLRRQNRIRTIQGSLAIEGNTLDTGRVTAVLDGKHVLGPKKDVLEVQNAIKLYGGLHDFNPTSINDLLAAHRILMKGLSPEAGKFRSGAVGILRGSRVSHLAPPAKQVARLMDDLMSFLKTEREISPILRACAFHYELEFIHPFSDGNGRMGRFWQSLVLTRFNPIFEYLPVESLIREKQAAYYMVLEKSDRAGSATPFLEFSLAVIQDALTDFLDDLRPEPQRPESRLELARREFGDREFSRKDYLRFFKVLSTATASRDLALGTRSGVLRARGAQATTRYRFT